MKKIIDYKWFIFLFIIFLWLLGTLSIGYSTYTTPPPVGSTNIIETFKMVFLILGGLGVVLPTYISATNAIESRDTQILENTIRLIEKWDDPHLFAARKLTRELKDKKDELSDIALVNQINGDDELRQSVILVMNYFELLRISSNKKRIDIDLYKSSYGPVVYNITERLRPYVKSLGERNLQDWDQIIQMYKS